MDKRDIEKTHAVMDFCRGLFNANLIGTDLEDIVATRVKRPFVQDSTTGVRIEFSVSDHMIGKLDGKTLDALSTLLGEK